jgi:hypothetical protein
VKVDLMMLANHAEDHSGLLTIVGGSWDSVNVAAPIQGAPDNVFAVMQGTLVMRLLFHPTETNRSHRFEVRISDADGAEIAKLEDEVMVMRLEDLPPAWDQGVNLVIQLTGLPLPAPGLYVITLNVDGQFMADRPFRVIKSY